MALNTQMSDTAANAACAAVTALCNSGDIKLYTTAQPANANTAIAAQTLLATLTFGATAFGAPAAGVATANAITGANAVASGTAVWFRVLKSDHATVVFDGSVGTSGANINMNSNVISAGAAVSITALTYSIVEAGA